MAEDNRSGRGPGGRKPYARWSAALGRRLCERLAQGELLYRICAEPGMPTPEGVAKWAKAKPEFGEALLAARRAGGRAGKRGCPIGYSEEIGDEIFERLCEGQSLTEIGRDPTMPSLSTIFYWRRRVVAFEDAVQMGKQIQAERFCDRGTELLEAATPETAYLTQVRLAHLRWVAGVMAPKVFRLKPAEPEKPPREINYLIRRFTIEKDPETGKQKVVGWCPNPWTGEVEREDRENGWQPPPGTTPMPSG